MNTKELRLDHFQFYDLEVPKPIKRLGRPVMLKGQFDQEAEKIKPQFLTKFANPVSKNGGLIFGNVHLTWYTIASSVPATRRIVTVANQFGEQEIVIYRVVGMLVPALKRSPGGVFPRNPTELDHYKVYRVIDGRPVGISVTLRDQFQAGEVRVGDPVAFAVPVRKERDGTVFPIHDENAHLTIYKMTSSGDKPHTIDARDQFGLHRGLTMCVSYLLAVPSRKVQWK